MKKSNLILLISFLSVLMNSEESLFFEGYWRYDMAYMTNKFDMMLRFAPEEKKNEQKERNEKLKKLLSTSVVFFTNNRSVHLIGIKKYINKYEVFKVDDKNVDLNYLENEKKLKIEHLDDDAIVVIDGKLKYKLIKISKEDALPLVKENNAFFKVEHNLDLPTESLEKEK